MASRHEVSGHAGEPPEGPTKEVRHFIQDLQKWSGENARAKGFRDRGDLQHLPELIALMHSELSEALEEYRNGHVAREVYFTTDKEGLDKPEGIVVELADCVIRILHCCDNFGMDLGAVIDMKLQYNAKRGHKHGGKVI